MIPSASANQKFGFSQAFPGGSVVKNLPANAGDVGNTDSIPRSGRFPRVGDPTPVFLPGRFHGQRRMVGCRQQGCKE